MSVEASNTCWYQAVAVQVSLVTAMLLGTRQQPARSSSNS